MGKTGGQSPEEHLLWLRLKDGDRLAFAELYEIYAGILFNYGYHLCHDGERVKDAMHDLFADLWRLRENLSPTTSVKYYLFRAMRRRIHRIGRAESLKTPFDAYPDAAFPIPAAVSAEFAQIEKETEEGQIRALQRALLELPERQVEAVRLRFFEGFELSQIAEIMQINEQSVRNLIQRSLLKLKKSLDLLLPLLAGMLLD